MKKCTIKGINVQDFRLLAKEGNWYAVSKGTDSERGIRMEALFEFLFVIPEIFADCVLGAIFWIKRKSEDGREIPLEQYGALYAIVGRMAKMPPVQKRKLKLFNLITFLVIGGGIVGIAILTANLMELYSGWFLILGIAVQVILTVVGYQWWKKMALRMTAQVQ